MLAVPLTAGEWGTSATMWARFTLPHRDPGAVYAVENNGAVFSIQGKTIIGDDGRPALTPIPSGVIPRQALTYITTMAARTSSQVVDLGGSFDDFMRRIGVSRGGKSRILVKRQMEALLSSTMTVSWLNTRPEDGALGKHVRSLSVADGWSLFFNGDESSPLWGSQVQLTEPFFKDVQENGMPVFLDDLKALAGSPMRLDIYLWLCYRLHSIRTAGMRVPWAKLRAQFGAGYERMVDFRRAFRRELAIVTDVYDAANVEVSTGGVTLHRSPPRVDGAGNLLVRRPILAAQ